MKHLDHSRCAPMARFAAAVLIASGTLIPIGLPAAQDTVERIDALMTSRYPADRPGAVVLAARKGQPVFHGAYGLASVELQVPVEPEMVFCLASITKLFTAVAALKLVEQGKLALDDAVIDYLPELTNTAGVTIAHLLSHTSGMTGPISADPGYRERNIHLEISSADLIASYAAYPLKFEPGTQFEYSNEGVATLARIVELVARQPWEEFLQKQIFEPAGLTSTYYGGHDRIIAGAVSGYTETDGGWRRANPTSYTRGFGMGGLFSTAGDLLAFHNALQAGRLVKPETLKSMFTPFPLSAGGHSRHGFGFVVTDLHGRKMVVHGGSHAGWSTFVALLPEDEIFVTVLTNRSPGQHSARDDALAVIEVLLEQSRAVH